MRTAIYVSPPYAYCYICVALVLLYMCVLILQERAQSDAWILDHTTSADWAAALLHALLLLYLRFTSGRSKRGATRGFLIIQLAPTGPPSATHTQLSSTTSMTGMRVPLFVLVDIYPLYLCSFYALIVLTIRFTRATQYRHTLLVLYSCLLSAH